MTAAYLTPKQTNDEFKLPVCPPPPRATHKPLGLGLPFPTLSLSGCLDDGFSSDNEDGPVCFAAPSGFAKKSSTKNLPAKRSRDGRSTKQLPMIRLKPRPSKHTMSSRPANATGLSPILLKPRPSRYTMPSHQSQGQQGQGQEQEQGPANARGSRKTTLHSLTRSSSFQRAFHMSSGKKSTLPRRPSFSRAA